MIENLIDDDQFWQSIYETCKDTIIALPIVFDHKVLRDFASALHCGDCNWCCEKYEHVQLYRRDLRKLESANIDVSSHTFQELGFTFMKLYNHCIFLENNRCSIYTHRPDGCYFAPVQFGPCYDTSGKIVDPRLHVRIECLPAIQAIRSLFRGALLDNPGSTLLPNLTIKLGSAE